MLVAIRRGTVLIVILVCSFSHSTAHGTHQAVFLQFRAQWCRLWVDVSLRYPEHTRQLTKLSNKSLFIKPSVLVIGPYPRHWQRALTCLAGLDFSSGHDRSG